MKRLVNEALGMSAMACWWGFVCWVLYLWAVAP